MTLFVFSSDFGTDTLLVGFSLDIQAQLTCGTEYIKVSLNNHLRSCVVCANCDDCCQTALPGPSEP